MVPTDKEQHPRRMAAELRRKCFGAELHGLTNAQAQAVEAWATDACARHRLVKSSDGWVLAAQRDKARCAKMHARLLRSSLKRLQIYLPATGKVWLRLLDDGEEAESTLSGPATPLDLLSQTAAGREDDDGDAKIIDLPIRRATKRQRATSCKPTPPRPTTSTSELPPPEPTVPMHLPACLTPAAVTQLPLAAAPRPNRTDATPPSRPLGESQEVRSVPFLAFERYVAECAETKPCDANRLALPAQAIPTERSFRREMRNSVAVAWNPFGRQ